MSTTTPLHRLAQLLLVLILGVLQTYAQSDLRMPAEVRVAAGGTADIVIEGTLDVPDGAWIVIEMAYTPTSVRPLRATGDIQAAMRCPDVRIAGLAVVDRSTGTFGLTCDSTTSVTNAKVCTLTVQGLQGPDTLGAVHLVRITANGVDVPLVQPPTTRVVVTGGIPVVPVAKEGIMGNFPNPFNTVTRIEYIVTEPGEVEFDVRDLGGRLFRRFDPVFRQPGTYDLELRPDMWDMSSGHYLVRMSTSRGIYLHTITVQK